MAGRRAELAQAREEEKQHKAMLNEWAKVGRDQLETPDVPCPDFLIGLCREQGFDRDGTQECKKGVHGDEDESKTIPCNICAPRGAHRTRFQALSPPWKFCMQGPRCAYNHAEWHPQNNQRALRMRQEARDKATAADPEFDEDMAQQSPAPLPATNPHPPTPARQQLSEEQFPQLSANPRAKAKRYVTIKHRLTAPPRHNAGRCC